MRKRRPPRTLEVIRKTTLTPHMLRVTLSGEDLADFPDDQDGAYVKLHVSDRAGHEDKPLLRTYTVRHYRPAGREVDVDFVLHEEAGPAADWARSCQPGDRIKLGGPGPKKMADHSADWFIFAGDMSALPAISANLEALPADAKGYALLEIIDVRDKQDIAAPKGLALEWIVNPHPEKQNTVLLDAVRNIGWLQGSPYAWVAGEFSQSLAIRAHLKESHQLARNQMYASSYWQIGQTEDGHRVAKAKARDN